MDHNPLNADLESAASHVKRLGRRRAKLVASVDWYRSFDRSAAVDVVDAHRTTCTEVETELADVVQELASGRERGEELRQKSKLGLNIGYWFSLERHAAKEEGGKLYGRLVELEGREKELADQLAQTSGSLATADRELTKYDNFDLGSVDAEVAALGSEIPLRQLELDGLAARKRALDVRLEEPIQALSDLQETEDQIEDERHALLGQVSDLESDISRARRYDLALDAAESGYERALIHEECESRLGSGKPRAVINDRRRRLSNAQRDVDAKERQLSGIRRNIAKAEARIEKTVERGTRDIRAFIVDGSNLCYQRGAFIGLPALRSVCDELSEAYDVTVVFDASIRGKLGGLTDRDLRAALPSVAVHAVASRAKADETILSAAEDPFVYILSNDRFAEYQEKPAVRDRRLIRHEIINGRVLVHDLDVDVPFAAGA